MDQINNLVLSFDKALTKLDGVISSNLAFLVMSISKKIIESTPCYDDKSLLKKIKKLFKDEKIVFSKPKLFINPYDKEIVEKHFKTIFLKYGWTIFYDKKVSKGGFIIYSKNTILDSTMSGRWIELCKLVFKKEE